MVTVVDSLQECNKVDTIYRQLLTERTLNNMPDIDIPSILIRIKPSEVAISKVEVSNLISKKALNYVMNDSENFAHKHSS